MKECMLTWKESKAFKIVIFCFIAMLFAVILLCVKKETLVLNEIIEIKSENEVLTQQTLQTKVEEGDEEISANLNWFEYEALAEAQKEAFFESFNSVEEFERWMNNAQRENYENALTENNSKKLSEYTWDEYNALTEEQKEIFFESFESVEDFEVWLIAAQKMENEPFPWEKEQKSPLAYSRAEYEALSEEEKEAFFEWFASAEEFQKWYKSVEEN